MADRTLIPADPDLWRRTGHAVPSTEFRCATDGSWLPCEYPVCGCQKNQAIDQRFRDHEGDDYPMTDENREFRAYWWRVGLALTVAIWGAVVMALLPA